MFQLKWKLGFSMICDSRRQYLKWLWYIAAQELSVLWQKSKRNQEEQDRASVSQCKKYKTQEDKNKSNHGYEISPLPGKYYTNQVVKSSKFSGSSKTIQYGTLLKILFHLNSDDTKFTLQPQRLCWFLKLHTMSCCSWESRRMWVQSPGPESRTVPCLGICWPATNKAVLMEIIMVFT